MLDRFDASAESGTETMMRLWLRAHRIAYRTQVEIDEVGQGIIRLVRDDVHRRMPRWG